MTTATPNEKPYQAFEILPRLYLSSFPTTPEQIPDDITHVLNMCTTPSAPDTTRTYLHIPLLDWDDISPHLSSIISFISSALSSPATIETRSPKVLVHCALGVNRSAAAVIAYLVSRNEGWGSEQAVGFLRGRKADVKPSGVFLGQIDGFFGRRGGREDVLVGFYRRLEERKRGVGGGEKMGD
ncbi:Tyrosine-protein phosphatase yvh1 [Lachnellula arida]|uniref:protein-tyrosine-phosphatase n=1 Tax=Lachnellula arida TaxID=1316785 RepID=A0A8T9BA81_9HELO|nr:Tyrosine-protein phosphatase yvh1 [Lachnellula arida]